MLDQAMHIPIEAHGDQNRKDTEIPYITHSLIVCMILSQAGYT